MNNRRQIGGYVEPIPQSFKTYQNSQINVPTIGNVGLPIDNAVAIQPQGGGMHVHAVPTQNTRAVKSTPFVRDSL